MNYYLVCDGGGTKTECMVFNAKGVVLGYSEAGGTNALFIENATSILETIIQQTLKKSQKELDEIHKIALFIPGFEKCINELRKRLAREDIIIEGDEINAFYSAMASSTGIVANCGTGSFVIGRDVFGEKFVAGGWGPLFGDFGSGYHIGILCLTKVTMLFDMGIRNTVLEKYTLENIGIKSVEELRRVGYEPEFTRARVAELAKVVAKSAAEGDIYAEEILDIAAKSIVEQIGIIRNLMPNGSIPVTLVGGVTKIGSLFTEKVKRYLYELTDETFYVESKIQPIAGGAIYLLNQFEGISFPNPLVEENIVNYEVR